MIRAEFITLNNFTLIPVTRYIIQFVSQKIHTDVTECIVDGQYFIGFFKIIIF